MSSHKVSLYGRVCLYKQLEESAFPRLARAILVQASVPSKQDRTVVDEVHRKARRQIMIQEGLYMYLQRKWRGRGTSALRVRNAEYARGERCKSTTTSN